MRVGSEKACLANPPTVDELMNTCPEGLHLGMHAGSEQPHVMHTVWLIDEL
jgi:hypothetical protein